MPHEILLGSDREPSVGHTALHPHYAELLKKLNSDGVSFVIIGAIAVALAGYNRLTRDLDAVCRDVLAMTDALYRAGFRIVSHPLHKEPGAYAVFDTPESAVESLKNSGRPSFKCIHYESRWEFDVWIASPEAAKISLEEIETHAVSCILSGIAIKRACAEHLIVLKQIALADNPSRQGTDGSDIAFLERYLKEHGPELL